VGCKSIQEAEVQSFLVEWVLEDEGWGEGEGRTRRLVMGGDSWRNPGLK
jgi:hypothetical protein